MQENKFNNIPFPLESLFKAGEYLRMGLCQVALNEIKKIPPPDDFHGPKGIIIALTVDILNNLPYRENDAVFEQIKGIMNTAIKLCPGKGRKGWLCFELANFYYLRRERDCALEFYKKAYEHGYNTGFDL